MGLLFNAKTAMTGEATLTLNPELPMEMQTELVGNVMPAEWFPQSGVMLTWPHAGTDWTSCLRDVEDLYVKIAYRISNREKLLIVAPDCEKVESLLRERLPQNVLHNIMYCQLPTNDTWTRDHGFLTVRKDGLWLLKDFRFDGWGGKFEARLDNAINRGVYEAGFLNGTYSDCLDFTLEGGSIESDGRGTLMTTSRCLLNENRNGGLSQAAVEERLHRDLLAKRVLWLHHGFLKGDDTDSHIDTLARFCPNDTIVYVKCDDEADEHFEELRLMEEELQQFRTLEDKPYRLLPLPMPEAIVEDGERLPATYANFLVMNDEVVMPTYGQSYQDEAAMNVLRRAFPDHDVTGLDGRVLIRQHGSLHCSTMQFPRGIMRNRREKETDTY